MVHGKYICCVCGAENDHDGVVIRELTICGHCGSNARFRALAASLTHALHGAARPLSDVSPDKSLRGFGVSDWEGYASRLGTLYDYVNTFLHQEPFLDIEKSDGFGAYAGADFCICSDVVEHTLTPPEQAVRNIYAALAPGGVLILSNPSYDIPVTIEKYPTLSGYETIPAGDTFHVRWRTPLGAEGVDEDPLFHGGPGAVLEMRVISHRAMVRALSEIGFREVARLPDAELERFGALWTRQSDRRDLVADAEGWILVARK